MNANQQIERFINYVNEASIPQIPRTAILYRNDGTPILATEVPLDPEVLRILSAKETSDYGILSVGELIQRSHASASLLAHIITITPKVRTLLSKAINLTGVPDGEILAVNYESPTEVEMRAYPVTRDAGAMRLTTFAITQRPKAYLRSYFL